VSALDDAYKAAERADESVAGVRHGASNARTSRAAVNAFLAHLADNMPDEMVETAMGWLDEVAVEADAGTLDSRDCAKDAEGLLSAALRSIQGVKADA
jgi:hypothetical protein